MARMPAATARRCLLTLEELGYVTRRGRQFLLRPKVLELGAAYLESMDIEHLTKTHLEELARLTGDSAALSVLDGNDIVYVARTSVRTLMRLEAHVGSRFPGARDLDGPRAACRARRRSGSRPTSARRSFVALTDSHGHRSAQAPPVDRGVPQGRLFRGRGRARLRGRRGRGAGARPVRPGRRRAQQFEPLAQGHQGADRARAPGDADAGEPRDFRASSRACPVSRSAPQV